MKRTVTFGSIAVALLVSGVSRAQIDPALLKRTAADTATSALNMDAVYRRPFMSVGSSPVSVGGYMEVNWQHIGTDGVSDGHQFQFRRFTLFVSSTITDRIKFLSELEFEDGAREISVEFAAVDVEFDPLFNVRGGVIVNPIGAFNQNHDGPKWEFVDRPIAMTAMLPATWSTAGFGLFGKRYWDEWMVGYEMYLSGGFDNSIIANDQNRTFLPAARENADRFEESASGEPLVTGKVAIRNRGIGEVGLSYMGGVYNRWQADGFVLDSKRRCDIVAIDLHSTLPFRMTVNAEWAWVFVDVPATYSQQFGSRQRGGFIDIVQPVLSGTILGWPAAVVNLACRLEFVDWNVGTFAETGGQIGDDLWSIVPSVSFRPASGTVIRLNYRYQRQRDILGNPPATTGGFLFGFSTYF